MLFKYQYILAANPISIRVLERHIPGMVCLMRCSLLHVAKRWSFAHSSSLGPSARRISESANAGSARVQANTGCLFSWKIPVTIAKKKSRRRRDHLQHTGNDFGFEFDRHFQGFRSFPRAFTAEEIPLDCTGYGIPSWSSCYFNISFPPKQVPYKYFLSRSRVVRILMSRSRCKLVR